MEKKSYFWLDFLVGILLTIIFSYSIAYYPFYTALTIAILFFVWIIYLIDKSPAAKARLANWYNRPSAQIRTTKSKGAPLKVSAQSGIRGLWK